MEEATFRVEIKGLKATQITSRNRFKDHLKVYGVLDDKKFKTKKLLIGKFFFGLFLGFFNLENN